MCGLVLAENYYFSWWTGAVVVAGLIAGLVFENRIWRKIVFYSSIIVIGYAIFTINLYIEHPGFLPELNFVRNGISKAIYYNFPKGEESRFVAGLFLGKRELISARLLQSLRCTNTIHILAISGLHVGCIGIIFLFGLRLLMVPRKLAALLSIIGILVYVSVVGWRAPAFRAAVMFIVLAGGWIYDRPVDVFNSLFFAALVILIVEPDALFSAGFQLSFMVVLSLLLLVPALTAQIKIKGFLKYIVQTFLVSLVAWLGALPLVAYYFQIISPISIIANVIIVPLMSLGIVLGFVSIIVGQIYLPISGVFNAVNYYLLKSILLFISRLAGIPGAWFYCAKISFSLVTIYYIILYSLYYFLLPSKTDVI